MHKYVPLMLVAALAATSAVASPVKSRNHDAAAAKISLDSARKAALSVRPGKITDHELESEPGGSGLRWSFDITSKGKSFEVGIDAKTGAVLENSAEGPHPD